MRPDELPANACIFETRKAIVRKRIDTDHSWNERLDLTDAEAWSLTLPEFDRFRNALKVSGSRRSEKDLITIRRKISNRQLSRLTREKNARKLLNMRLEIEALRAEVEATNVENFLLRAHIEKHRSS